MQALYRLVRKGNDGANRMNLICRCPNAVPRSTGFVTIRGKPFCAWCRTVPVQVKGGKVKRKPKRGK